MASMVAGYNVAKIRNLFHEYVEGMGDKPRHTLEANYETELYSQFVAGVIPANEQLREALYEHMMDCAVEFEESGFIAGFQNGFRHAMNFFQPNGGPVRIEAISITPETETASKTASPASQTAEKKDSSTNAGASRDQIPNVAPGKEEISSDDIAVMFEDTNPKVVRRIEELILPRLNKQVKQGFRMEIEYTRQNRRRKVYYLDKTACDLYMDAMDPYKKYVNIAGGLVKMRELMKVVFPAEMKGSKVNSSKAGK